MSSPLTEEPKSETLAEDSVATSVPAGTASEQSSGRTSNNEEERKGNEVAEEEEEEGECGLCLFMKRGGCGEAFIALDNCCHEARKNKENMEDKCFEIRLKLMQCMKAHADYYKPMEEAAQQSQTEAVLNESEKEPAQEEK